VRQRTFMRDHPAKVAVCTREIGAGLVERRRRSGLDFTQL
jgi:hypothetical protein